MTITPTIQRLLYGTIAAIGISVSGTLWWARTPDGGRAKMRDFVDVYQSCVEHCLATAYVLNDGMYDTNLFSTVQVYTNRVPAWGTDPSGRTYIFYSTNGTPTVTNYMIKTGDADVVMTNVMVNSLRVAIPRASTELSGSDGRYIWNAYSNLVVSGLSNASCNGTYVFVTNGYLARPRVQPALTNDPIGHILYQQSFLLGNSDITTVYSNTASTTRFLFDLGPRDTLGDDVDGSVFTENFKASCAIVPVSGTHACEYFTYRGDSATNGPWIIYSGAAPAWMSNAMATVTHSGSFSSNLMRDALCRWYINKEAWTVYDPRYEWQGSQRISPELRGSAFQKIKTAVQSMGNGYFIKANVMTSAGEFTNLPNSTDWSLFSMSYTQALANAGLPSAYTNHNPPTTQDVARYSSILKQYQWTRSIEVPVQDFFSSFSNQSEWVCHFGESTNSWAEAKSIAETNEVTWLSLGWDPGVYSLGYYFAYTNFEAESHVWQATASTIEYFLTYYGATTNIQHTIDFYVSADPAGYYGGYPLYAISNTVFDANGFGVVQSNYIRVASVGPSIDPFPTFQFGSRSCVPTWCADPETVKRVDGVGVNAVYIGETARGFNYKGVQAVGKWQWNYNTN